MLVKQAMQGSSIVLLIHFAFLYVFHVSNPHEYLHEFVSYQSSILIELTFTFTLSFFKVNSRE